MEIMKQRDFLAFLALLHLHDMRDKALGKSSNNKSYCVFKVSQGKRQMKSILDGSGSTSEKSLFLTLIKQYK